MYPRVSISFLKGTVHIFNKCTFQPKNMESASPRGTSCSRSKPHISWLPPVSPTVLQETLGGPLTLRPLPHYHVPASFDIRTDMVLKPTVWLSASGQTSSADNYRCRLHRAPFVFIQSRRFMRSCSICPLRTKGCEKMTNVCKHAGSVRLWKTKRPIPDISAQSQLYKRSMH